MKKRVISFVLALLLTASVMPKTVYALPHPNCGGTIKTYYRCSGTVAYSSKDPADCSLDPNACDVTMVYHWTNKEVICSCGYLEITPKAGTDLWVRGHSHAGHSTTYYH